jgi:hypothetical protein
MTIKAVHNQSLIPVKATKAHIDALVNFLSSSKSVQVSKAKKGEEGVAPTITIIASSNNPDLDNDRMARTALERMVEQAPGTTVFMNHQYKVPEDVFGSVLTAELVELDLPIGRNGEAIPSLCLQMDVVVEILNPRAQLIYSYVEAGRVTLGTSVGVIVTQADKAKDGTQEFEDLYYLEVSIVGIPANQQAWVQPKGLGDLMSDMPGDFLTAIGRAKKALDELSLFGRQSMPQPPQEKQLMKPKFKTLWDQAVAEMESHNLYEVFWTLQDAINDMIEAAEDGKLANPEAELRELLAGFSEYVIGIVLPALKTTAASDEESGLDTGDDADASENDDSAGDADSDLDAMSGDDRVEYLRSFMDIDINRVMKLLKGKLEVLKVGSRHSKNDMKLIQGVHDMTVELDAVCKTKEAEDDKKDDEAVDKPANAGDSSDKPADDKAAKGIGDITSIVEQAVAKQLSGLREAISAGDTATKQLQGQVETLQKQLDEATADSTFWKEQAEAALADLENFSKAPKENQ